MRSCIPLSTKKQTKRTHVCHSNFDSTVIHVTRKAIYTNAVNISIGIYPMSYPIFDPFLFLFSRFLSWKFPDEISAGRYFKIPHFCFEDAPFIIIIIYLFTFFIIIIFFIFSYYFLFFSFPVIKCFLLFPFFY